MREGKNRKIRALLVFGAPCSGKTTFCEQFAKQFHAPFFDLETLKNTCNLTRSQQLMLVEQLAKTYQTLVIEGGLDTEKHRSEIRDILKKAGYDPKLIWIQTDVATLKSRLKSRLKSTAKAKAEYDSRIKKLEAPSELEKPIVLSGKHTYQTQLKHVLTNLA